MTQTLELHHAARRSLLSVVLTAVLITINHLSVLGPKAFGLGAVLIVVPSLLLWWFKRTQSNAAFGGYLVMNLWVVIGFGVLKGLWKSALPVFAGTLLSALSTSYPRPTLAPVWVEVSGVAMLIGSAFVAAFAYRLVRARWGTARASILPASAGVLALGVIVAAYVVTDRDRWVAPSNGIVKIGVIVPTGGPYVVLGSSFLKAVQMAQSDLRDTKYQYQLVLVDVGQDPYQARAAIQRAIQDERVSAIVGGISRFGQVTRPLASAAQILHTCVCSVTSIGDGAYNFTNIPSPEAEGVRWVQEAQRRGIRNIALLTQDYPSIQGHLEALKVEVRRAGLTITDAQEFDDSVTDFRKLIARARASHPDVYYVEALNPQLDELAQQLADAKIRNIASVVAPSVSQRPELFEATWYTDSNLRDFAFKTRFEKLYPGTQFATHMMPYAYDDFNMIVQAFERGENPAVYVRNIRTYDGNAGTLTKLAGSGNFQSMPAVWEIEHGKPVLLSHQ
ncbi:MAG: ABC transporter substrate-binding protein [Actinobacteria bacterium]|nr:MAG: ABC transporter substrate-binding protein [Actinomycetota bacterium]